MMEEHDDEVTMFDRTSLLDGSKSTKQPTKCSKLIYTFALFGAIFTLGLALAIPGPTLTYLACNVSATYKTISYIFPARSLGYLLGSIVGGFLFDKFSSKDKLLMTVALLLSAIGIGGAPWTSSLVVLCLLLSLASLAMGFIDTGGNVICLRIWGKSSGPYLQALHFSFGVGAFLAPLIVVPFLSAEGLSCNITTSSGSLSLLTTTPIIREAHGIHKRGDLPVNVSATAFLNESVTDYTDLSTLSSAELTTTMSAKESVTNLTPAVETATNRSPDAGTTEEEAGTKPRTGSNIGEKDALHNSGNGIEDAIAKAKNKMKLFSSTATTTKTPPPTVCSNAKICNVTSPKAANTTTDYLLSSDTGEQDDNNTSVTTESYSSTSLGEDPTMSLAPDTSTASLPTMTSPATTRKVSIKQAVDTADYEATTKTLPLTSASAAATTDEVATAKLSTSTTSTATQSMEIRTSSLTSVSSLVSTQTSTLPVKSTTISTKPTAQDETHPTISLSSSPSSPVEHEETTTNSTTVADNRNVFEQARDFLYSISKVQFSYLIIAITMFVFSLSFCCMDSNGCCSKAKPVRQASLADLSGIDKRTAPPIGYKVRLMIFVFIFFFLYVGVEVAYGQFVATFGILHYSFSEKQGALVTSVYWGCFALARGLAVPISKCLSPTKMLIISIIITISSSIGLCASSYLSADPRGLWFFSSTLGIGMAAIFPTGVLWLEGYIEVTAKMASVFVVGSSLGEMVVPTVVGLLIEKSSELGLLVVVLVCVSGCALTFFAMHCSANQKQKYSVLREQEAIAMQDFEFSSSEDTDMEPILKNRRR